MDIERKKQMSLINDQELSIHLNIIDEDTSINTSLGSLSTLSNNKSLIKMMKEVNNAKVSRADIRDSLKWWY